VLFRSGKRATAYLCLICAAYRRRSGESSFSLRFGGCARAEAGGWAQISLGRKRPCRRLMVLLLHVNHVAVPAFAVGDAG